MTTNSASQPEERFYVLGSGSIGLLLAASTQLVAPGKVKLLLRDHHRHMIQNNHNRNTKPYIQVCIQPTYPIGIDHRRRQHQPIIVPVPVQLISELNNNDSHKIIRNLVVTTKTFQALPAISALQSSFDTERVNVLILCNGGIAVRDEILSTKILSPYQVHVGMLTHGAYRPPPSSEEEEDFYTVIHAGFGKIAVPAHDSLEFYSQIWKEVLQCKTYPLQEMNEMLWYKLAANAVCNPLTAIRQCTNGDLYNQIDDFEHVLRKIVEEVVQVRNAVLSEKDSKVSCAPSTPMSVEQTIAFVKQVISDNFENQSSMQQDVQYERRTEIDSINGYVARVGERYHIACPVNEDLVKQIKALENGYKHSK